MQAKRLTRAFRVLVAALALAGCRTTNRYQGYDGGARATSEVVRLQLPEEVTLLRVDGAAPAMSVARLAGLPTELHLLPGPHRISVRYSVIWPISKDYHETVRSDPVVLELDGQAGDVYTVSYEKPRRLRQAKQFARDPVFELVKTN